MKIGFIVERRYLRQEMPGRAIEAFQKRGVETDLLLPHDAFFEPEKGLLHSNGGAPFDLNRYDAIVSRNRTPLGLALLAYADGAGVPAFNSHASTQRVRNKAKMAGALGRAGIFVPPTLLADDVSTLAGLSEEWFPLILKATYGDNSQGLRLVRHPEELGQLHWGDGLVLAQRYLSNDGFDLKLYVCGETVFAVRKPSPFNGDPKASPRPVRPDAEMVRLALHCGRLFDLDIYGVDTIETVAGRVVIEINEFPNFTGVPGAAETIVAYILEKMKKGICKEKV